MPNKKFKPILLIPILFFLFIFLSAFARQPANTSASAPTPTPTSIYAVPRLQLPQVDPLPITTPDAPADQYTLANWNTDTAKLALANFRMDTDLPREQPNAYLTLLEESYLQFPELAQDESFLLELATIRDVTSFPEMNPRLMDTLPSLLIYTQLLEDALNQGDIQPDNVEEWIYKNMTAINVDTEISGNIFKGGTGVDVYHILKFEGYYEIILFVNRLDVNTFKVTTFSGNEWENANRWNDTMRIMDLNQSAVPDIAREKLTWWHGSDKSISSLSVYEWNDDRFVNLAPHVKDITWNATNKEKGYSPFTYVGDRIGLGYIVGNEVIADSETCSFQKHTIYAWTGYSFEKSETYLDPIENSASSGCRLLWAETAGKGNEQSLIYLEEAISDWPENKNEEVDTASLDLYRLKLADAYAIQGQIELALQTLDELILQPTTPQYSGIPKMAEIYQKAYTTYGPYVACKSINQWQQHDLVLRKSDSQTSSPMEIAMQNWGINEQDFCDEEETFQMVLQQQNFTSLNQLVRWLYQNQVQWNGLKELDLNDDGIEDWLVVTHTGINDSNQLWALIQQDGHIDPVLLAETNDNIEELTISINPYYPPWPKSVFIYQMGSQVVVFQITGCGNRYLVNEENIVQHIIPAISLPYIQFTAGNTENPVRGVEIKDNILTIYFKRGISQYQWHYVHNRFELLQSTADEPDPPSLEELLFVEQNPQAVIDELEIWFTTIDPDSDDSWERSFIENTLPYHTYLLGLAYELNGEEQHAAQTYFNLWQTYPENPFTVIARYKLEKK